ncbi:MAG: PaaI family thioesterase [Candidatus Nanopelagicales bacterium]
MPDDAVNSAKDDHSRDAQVLAHIADADRGGLGERMRMEWIHTAPDRVVARIPVEGNTQPFGLLHGGASAVLAESVGSVLANLNAGSDRYAVGIELSCTHHRSARTGWVTAVATPLSVGRTLVTAHIVVRDEDDRPICTARLSCFLRDAEAGS